MSLGYIKRFLYIGPTINLFDGNNSKVLSNIFSNVQLLLNENKTNELLNVLNDYLKFYSNYVLKNKNTNKIHSNIDCIVYLLACCSKLSKDEHFKHKVYEILTDSSLTPIDLFAFEFYSNLIQKNEIDKNQCQSDSTTDQNRRISKHIGKGHKKALIKWFNSKNELELLRVITQFRHSYGWTVKDLLKLIHMKPKNEGFDFIMKYVLYGFNKVKDEKLPDNFNNLLEFVKDLNNLKFVKTGEEAADLIRKQKFNFEHIPSKVFKYKEIWTPLVEQMNIQEFSENLHRLLKKDLLKLNSDLERVVFEKILSRDNSDIRNTHPIYLCLASQIYEHYTTLKLVKMSHQPSGSRNLTISERSSQDRFRDSIWNSFQSSIQHHKSQLNSPLNNLKVMIVVEINTLMRNGHTNGLNYLNPIDVSSAILLTLYYMNTNPANIDVFTASDKLTRIELADRNNIAQPDIGTIENIFQGFASIEKNPTDKIFEWALQNKKSYDFYLFLTSSDQNNKLIQSEMDFVRANTSSKDTKLVIVNLATKTEQNEEDKNQILNPNYLNLTLYGWNFDSFFVLDSFLKAKF